MKPALTCAILLLVTGAVPAFSRFKPRHRQLQRIELK
jgi:hypothetical protein